MMKKITLFLLIFSFSFLIGCISNKIDVQSTKQWEGHYYTSEQFYNSTTNIVLEKNESIWVLSNRTLNRLLQNAQGK